MCLVRYGIRHSARAKQCQNCGVSCKPWSEASLTTCNFLMAAPPLPGRTFSAFSESLPSPWKAFKVGLIHSHHRPIVLPLSQSHPNGSKPRNRASTSREIFSPKLPTSTPITIICASPNFFLARNESHFLLPILLSRACLDILQHSSANSSSTAPRPTFWYATKAS